MLCPSPQNITIQLISKHPFPSAMPIIGAFLARTQSNKEESNEREDE